MDANPVRQSMLEALVSASDCDVLTADELAQAMGLVEAEIPDAVLVFAAGLGDAADAMSNLIALREAASSARLVVCLEASAGLAPAMLHLAGVDEILAEPFEPLAVVSALLHTDESCPEIQAA